MTQFLKIGSVVLSGLEIPQELGDLGGRQTVVKHEFPGGVITIKTLGAFPHPVKWSGLMTGADAFARMQALDRLRAIGDEVELSFGVFAWSGVITEFKARPKHEFLVPYELAFEPTADLSGIGTIPFGDISPEAALGDALGAIDALAAGVDGLVLPDPLVDAANALTDLVGAALLNGNGTVAGMTPADVLVCSAAALALETLTLPYSGGSNPLVASPALDLSAQAAAVGFVLNSVNAGVREVRAINPNLFAIAQQFLGDAQRWGDIAAASGLGMDPQPTGAFTLQVPA